MGKNLFYSNLIVQENMEWRHSSSSSTFLPSQHWAQSLVPDKAQQAALAGWGPQCHEHGECWSSRRPQNPLAVPGFSWSVISFFFISFFIYWCSSGTFPVTAFHLLLSCEHGLALSTFPRTLGLFCIFFPPLYFCQMALLLLATKVKTSLWKVTYTQCWEYCAVHCRA